MIEIERRNKQMKEISLVPLINLVFLLLIFFLVAGTIEKFDVIPIELPLADSGKVLDEGHIVIVLGKHDEIVIGDDLVDQDGFAEALVAAMAKREHPVISLKADSQLEATKLVTIMDTIRANGGDYVSLVTQSVN